MRHVYGPIVSGRLGRSLGVDPFGGRKTCNFDCSYCQLGARDVLAAGPVRYADVAEVVREARCAAEGAEIDWVTISGSGEPTMHPRLGEMIDGLRRATGRGVAVVTNGSRLFRRDVRQALARADAVLPTLSAAEPGVHWLLHRPIGVGAFRRHVEGLQTFRDSYDGQFWLEVMLVGGINDDAEHVAALARIVERLRPDKVHITRPTRPGAERWVSEPSFSATIRAMRVLGGSVVRPEPTTTMTPMTTDAATDAEGVLRSIERSVRCHPMRELEALVMLRQAGVHAPEATLTRFVAEGNLRRVPGRRGVFLGPA